MFTTTTTTATDDSDESIDLAPSRSSTPPLTRQQRRDLGAIIRSVMGEACIIRETEDGALYAHRAANDEEGWQSRSVTAFPEIDSDATSRRYVVETHDAGQDCDGRSSRTSCAVVAPCKRTRWYWSRDWSKTTSTGRAGRPVGRFEVRPRFRRVGEVDSSQRDYSAEAAGY